MAPFTKPFDQILQHLEDAESHLKLMMDVLQEHPSFLDEDAETNDTVALA